MFSSIQSIPGLIFARSDVKAKIRPGVEASYEPALCPETLAGWGIAALVESWQLL